MKKMQVQVISLIIMTGIVISLVGVAYMWGAPVIDKRSAYTQYTSAEKFMNDLNEKITKLASTCTTPNGCTQTVDIPQIESSSITFDNDENTLYYRFPVNQEMLTEDEIAINTPYTGDIADYGTAPAGILTAQGITQNNVYLISFALKYRELKDLDSNMAYKIEIHGSVEGNSKIIMTYSGTEKTGDLTTSKIEFNVI